MTKQLLVHDKAKNVTRRAEKKNARIEVASQVEPSVLKVVSLYRTQRHEGTKNYQTDGLLRHKADSCAK